MKILYITSKPSYPKIDGGCVASANFIDNLVRSNVQITNLTIATEKHPFDRSAFPEYLSTNAEGIFISTAIRPFEALRSLLKKESYNINRFYSVTFSKRLVELLKSNDYDCIFLDSLYSTPYLQTIRELYSGKVFLRAHNVEFSIWEDLADNETNPLKKRYLKTLARELKSYELRTVNQMDGVFALSTNDIEVYSNLRLTVPMKYIPVSVNVENNPHNYKNRDVFHLGAMNWRPNSEAVEEILRMWPSVRSKLPNAEFHIAGLHSDTTFKSDYSNGIIVDGFVEDIENYISERGILWSPILSGSGIRIKILEMMAKGVPVVTTALGAQGLMELDGIEIANSTEDQINAVYELVTNENKRKELGERAKRYITLYHNTEKVSAEIIEFIKST